MNNQEIIDLLRNLAATVDQISMEVDYADQAVRLNDIETRILQIADQLNLKENNERS